MGYIHLFLSNPHNQELFTKQFPSIKNDTFKNNHYQAVVNIFVPETGFYFAANEVT